MGRVSEERALEQLGIAVIRGLAMDAPQQANSGHPGTAMALAPLGHVLFTRIMHHDPADPAWPDRDRFVLSAGHASILLYSLLYLTGYGLTLDDLRAFRQWGSRTPGHPEVHLVPGVEVTTGPLGQGFANAVGMALAERWLRARFGPEVIDHRVFAICSDGDLMEGISHEAASLAGHLGLGRLVCVYDDNHITIDGSTDLAYSDDVPARFRAYGWHVEALGEVANDTDALEAALRRAMAVEDRPSLLVLRSHIGWPAPTKTDTAAAHGSPLGEEEVRATKQLLGLPPEKQFWVPEEVLAFYRRCAARGAERHRAWRERPRGLARQIAGVRRGRRSDRHPPRHQAVPRRHGGAPARARVGRRRPHREHRSRAGRWQYPVATRPGGQPGPLRDPGARHGRGHDRHGPARWRPPGGRHFLRVQRLHAPVRPPRRPVRGARGVPVEPRLGGPGRGRPHAPADRAAGGHAGHAQPSRPAAGGRQ